MPFCTIQRETACLQGRIGAPCVCGMDVWVWHVSDSSVACAGAHVHPTRRVDPAKLWRQRAEGDGPAGGTLQRFQIQFPKGGDPRHHVQVSLSQHVAH